MGYVSEIVQSGITLADRAQVGQYVEKARSYERLDALIDLASQRAPDVVKQLDVDLLVKQMDQKLDLVVDGITDRKAKALESYNGAVEFVQQKKGDALQRCSSAKDLLEKQKNGVLERCSDAKELLEQKKDTVFNGAKELLEQKKDTVLLRATPLLERCNGAKDGAKELLEQKKAVAVARYHGAVEFVQEKKGAAQKFAQEKKDSVQSLAEERLPQAAQERLSQVQVQIGLLMAIVVAQYRSIVELPLALKQRIEQAFPELQQRYSNSYESAKSYAAQQLEQLPARPTLASAKSFATKQLEKLPELKETAKEQASKLREMAQAQLEAAKTLAAAKAATLRQQLPVYREQATVAVRDVMAYLKTRVPTKQA